MNGRGGAGVPDPSIKGTAFESAVDDVKKLLDGGALSRDVLDVKLGPSDLALLDAKISPASWYPIGAYERIVEVLIQQEARGRREAYLVERGRRAGERLRQTGIYQQLDLSTARLGPRVGKVMVSLASAIYNFTRWEFLPSESGGAFTIVVSEASDFPEVARYTAQGFLEFAATLASGIPHRVRSERPEPDRVVYHAEPST